MNKRILVIIVLAVLLALPVAAFEEKEQAITGIGEIVTLLIVLASAVILFRLSSMLAKGLKTSIVLLAIGIIFYGIMGSAIGLAEDYLSVSLGLYAQIVSIIGSVIMLLGSIYLYATIEGVCQKSDSK